MKTNHFILLLLITLFLSCSKTTYTPEFINQVSGRYLFSADEEIEVYFKENELLLKWRGGENLKPMDMGDNIFFVKEMNKKIKFTTNPKNSKQYISFVPGDENETIKYDFRKLDAKEVTPSTYFKKGDYAKALEGYKVIQAEDSTSVFIDESDFNRYGYNKLRDDKLEEAIEIFKINVALYPGSSNVYDSLAEAYLRSGDSLNAYNNYKKALELNVDNRRAKRYIKKYNEK